MRNRVFAIFGALLLAAALVPASVPSALGMSVPAGFAGVHFANASEGWVVGYGSTILHTTDGGTTWHNQFSKWPYSLSDIAFADTKNGWAVGGTSHGVTNAVVALHTSDGGAHWSAVPTGADQANPLMSLALGDASHSWLFGISNQVVKTANAGATWTQTEIPNEIYFSASAAGTNNCWVAGSGGTILHTGDGGATWDTQWWDGETYLYGIQFLNASNGWAVGEYNTLLHTTNGGANWSAQNPGYDSLVLGDVGFADANNGWLVGSDGTIMHTTDGGSSWAYQTTPTLAMLNRVSAVSASTAFAVGGMVPFGLNSDSANVATILRTTDAGATWTQVFPRRIKASISRKPRASKLTYRRRRGTATFTLAAHVNDSWGTSTDTPLVLQSSTNGRKWRSIARVWTNSAGNASKKLKLKKKGTTYHRWVVPGSALYGQTVTGKQRVRVK